MVIEQSAPGRMLDFGNLEIVSGSDGGIDIFQRIAGPVHFKKTMADWIELFGRTEPVGIPPGCLPAAPSDADEEMPGLMADLDNLRQKGLLTGEEFESKKRQVLNGF